MTTLISVPVHEKPTVVVNLLQNIKRFMPESFVIVHISQGFTKEPQPILDFAASPEGFPYVVINPERLDTQWAGMIQTHLSNFACARKLGMQFSHFAMHASNDMFVKEGAETYVASHDCGVHQFPAPPDMMWTPRRRAVHDPHLHAIMDELKIQDVVGSQIEGTFYRTEMFDEIWKLFQRHFDYQSIKQYMTKKDCDTSNTLYAREEIYFSTIASKICSVHARPYVFSEVMTGVKIIPQLIENIRSGQIDLGSCFEKRICDIPYRLYDPDNIFAVKRVIRDLDDPLRKFIGGL